MKSKLTALSRHYVTELGKFLRSGDKAVSAAALDIGHNAVASGFETLELACIHEKAIVTLGLTRPRSMQRKRAEVFFADAITPIIKTHHAAKKSECDLNQINAVLKKRTADLTAAHRRLKEGIAQRKRVEVSLKKSGRHNAKLLKDSVRLEQDLRRMTRQVLGAHEEKRSAISRELQNEIAQTLLGIHVRLLTLKREFRGNAKGIKTQITSTQQLVGKTARSAQRVARELRNT